MKTGPRAAKIPQPAPLLLEADSDVEDQELDPEVPDITLLAYMFNPIIVYLISVDKSVSQVAIDRYNEK